MLHFLNNDKSFTLAFIISLIKCGAALGLLYDKIKEGLDNDKIKVTPKLKKAIDSKPHNFERLLNLEKALEEAEIAVPQIIKENKKVEKIKIKKISEFTWYVTKHIPWCLK